MTAKAVVFDIGAVLVEWVPQLAWLDDLGTMAEVEAFMNRVSFAERNARADAGETFADLANEISDPNDRALLASYVSLYTKTVQTKVPGTWEILEQLRMRGTPIHAITNWSAETWPEGVKVHPQLDEVFGTLVVSGREHVSKPDAKIFHLLCERAGLTPEDCVFIDDSPKNVHGAQMVGMDAIHFTDAPALESALSARGFLT